MQARHSAFVLVATLVSSVAFAETNVSGRLATTTWTKLNSPYRVTGSITVPVGDTLTIEPGVNVFFDANVPVYVEGRIIAAGTPTDNILFLPGTATAWGGIRINGGDSSYFSYARISGGYANGTTPDDRGGAISIVGPGTRLGLSHVVLSGNRAQKGGGAIYAFGAQLTLDRCTVRSNTADTEQGGGIDAWSGSVVTISYSDISANTASGSSGGGIYLNSSVLIGDSLTFTGNRATAYNQHGGGVSAWEGSHVTLTRCDLRSNTVGSGSGGGLYINGSSVALSECRMTQNYVAWNGAGIEMNSSTGSLVDCVISGNRAGDRGGAVYVYNNAVANLERVSMIADTSNGDGGGGIYVQSATANLIGCVLERNLNTYAYGYGGGLRAQSATVTLDGCSFLADTCAGSESYGGGIWAQYSTLTMTGSPIRNCSARHSGGGMTIWNSSNATIQDCPIESNSATRTEANYGNGGGVRVYNATVLMERCPIRWNIAANSGGGILASDAANVTLRDMAISGNLATAGNGGGISATANTPIRVTNCPITDNTAGLDGGGLYTDASPSVRLENLLLARNAAQHGGAIRTVSSPSVQLINCTMTANSASVIGGAIRAYNSTLTAYQSIVWDNTPQEAYLDGSTISATYCDFEDVLRTGAGNLSSDPLFINPSEGDFSLSAGSPCIDAGDPAGLKDPNGTTMDIGALPYTISEISGIILTTTWTKANSPYRIANTVTIPPGNTLVIEPGVDVLFDANVEFIVQGSLIAVGTPADSIRFIKWLAPQWAGFRIVGGDTSAFAYARISHARADYAGEWWAPRGGGLYISDAGTRVGFSHSVIAYNWSYYEAGGVMVVTNARATFEDCEVRNDTSAYSSAGGIAVWNASASLNHCVVRDNWCNYVGGGIYIREASKVGIRNTVIVNNRAYGGAAIYAVHYGTVLTLDHVLTSGNNALWGNGGGGLYIEDYAIVNVSNSVFWGDTPNEVWNFLGNPINFFMSYTDVQGTYQWPGTGNIIADPLFADPANGDYRFQPTSPCIDAGDPEAPRDPDGSRTDMGPFFFMLSEHRLELPKRVLLVEDVAPNDIVTVPVRAWLTNARGVDMAFVADSSIFTPDTLFIRSNAFAGLDTAQSTWRHDGDTTFVALAAAEGLSLEDSALVELAFRIKRVPPNGTRVPLRWVPYPKTNANELSVVLADGEIGFFETPPVVHYGDVSDDGLITAFDASLILQYVVGTRREIDRIVADVTNNGFVSSYDAAHILYRVLSPGYVFPVEGGPLLKQGRAELVVLSWVRNGNGWSLVANHPRHIEAGELTFAVQSDAAVSVTGGDMIAYRQEGSMLQVAFVRSDDTSPILLHLESAAPLRAAPEVTAVEVNEGLIRVTVRPVELALDQNVPNPFNPTTTIRLTIPTMGIVSLAVYDVNGRLVRVLVDGTLEAGMHEIVWDGRDAAGRHVASGVYLYRLTTDERTVTRKMLLVR